MEIAVAPKRKDPRDSYNHPSNDQKIKPCIFAMAKGQSSTGILEMCEEAAADGEEAAGRELVWMAHGVLKTDISVQDYHDLEDRAEVKLHGSKICKCWASFKYVRR